MKETIRRVVRTLLQTGVSGVIVAVLSATLIEMTDTQVAGLTVLVTLLLTTIQNVLEEAEVVPKLLKSKKN